MQQEIEFQGRILEQISHEIGKVRGLKLVGRCYASSINHALYLMDKYCKEKDLVKYYLIEMKIVTEDNVNHLPINQETQMLIKFYKD